MVTNEEMQQSCMLPGAALLLEVSRYFRRRNSIGPENGPGKGGLHFSFPPRHQHC